MSTSKTLLQAESFLTALRRASKDRGKMAALRRALSPQNQMDAWPVIADLGGDIAQPVYATVAALYATHPLENKSANFGSTCRQIALQDSSDGKVPDSHARRFRRLLACQTGQEVSEHLRTWIRMAVAKGVGVNYEQLFTDLRHWDWYCEDIRVRWAGEFWPAHRAKEPTAAQEAEV